MQTMLIHGSLFEEGESSICPHRTRSLWVPGMLHIPSLCPFSRSFSSYPRCTNPSPKCPLAHLLHLKVPLFFLACPSEDVCHWCVYTRPAGDQGRLMAVGENETWVCRLGVYRLVLFEALCVKGKSQRWEEKEDRLGIDWFLLCCWVAMQNSEESTIFHSNLIL